MKTKSKNICIYSSPEKVFIRRDNFSKIRMNMSERFKMMMGMTIDFNEEVTKWQSPKLKVWAIVRESKIIIMSWCHMCLEITPAACGTVTKIPRSYLQLKVLFFKIFSSSFANWYFTRYMNNMLNDPKKNLYNKNPNMRKEAFRYEP